MTPTHTHTQMHAIVATSDCRFNNEPQYCRGAENEQGAGKHGKHAHKWPRWSRVQHIWEAVKSHRQRMWHKLFFIYVMGLYEAKNRPENVSDN